MRWRSPCHSLHSPTEQLPAALLRIETSQRATPPRLEKDTDTNMPDSTVTATIAARQPAAIGAKGATNPYVGIIGVFLGAGLATLKARLVSVGLPGLRGALRFGFDEALLAADGVEHGDDVRRLLRRLVPKVRILKAA